MSRPFAGENEVAGYRRPVRFPDAVMVADLADPATR